MGFKHDQRLPSEIHEEYLEALNQSQDEQLPPYSETVEDSSFNSHAQSYLHGPNTSQSGSASAAPMTLSLRDSIGGGISQESLGPPLPPPSEFNHGDEGDENGGRRVLLLVYIHGFVGDETSFGSFPAHVHGMVTRRLADTHVVYSKVFPKYKTRGNVTTVRDRFSEWLIERQSSRTDVILIGHSMGGIVAAEVALMPGSGRAGLKHRIVGTLNIDVPFLGMHPKVIGAGISSLFAGSPDAKPTGTPGLEGMGGIALMPVEPPGSEASTSTLSLPSSNQSTLSGLTSSLELPSPDDRHFNPVYANDNRVPTRKTFDNIAHFVSKHAMSDGLLKAGTKYVSSHLQFGGTMADYRKLDRRYKQLRALEMDEYGDVRFVNFFTTCHGRPKKVKPTKPAKAEKQPKAKPKPKAKGKGKDKESGNTEDGVSGADAVTAEAATTLEDQAEHQSPVEDMEQLSLTVTDPRPVSESSASHSEGESTPGSIEDFEDAQDYLDEGQAGSGTFQVSKEMQAKLEAGLPPVPLEPTPVPGFDASKYPDKDSLKLAERLYYRQLKAYQQAFKDRERVIKERNKVIQKRKEKMQKEKEKADQKAEKEALKVAKAKSKETAKEEQKRRAEEKNAEKNAEKEAQKKVKQLEKEALKEKKEAEKAEKARLKEEMKQKKKQQQQQAEQEGEDDDENEETDESNDEEEEGEGDLTPLGSLSSDQHLPDSSSSVVEPTIMKAQKLKTFCLTPPKALTARRKDWIPVFVADVDQVGAHCGLFKTDQPHYERFVESVVSKIEEWVQDVDGEIRI